MERLKKVILLLSFSTLAYLVSGEDFFSGSGSGSGSQDSCVCSRSMKCRVEGELASDAMAEVTGTKLECIIMFPSGVTDIGSGSSIVIADTFIASKLSRGSLSFLINLGVLTRDEGFVDCNVPNIREDLIQSLDVTYALNDGYFGNETLIVENAFPMLTPEAEESLGVINQCSLLNLVESGLTQPLLNTPPRPQCRQRVPGTLKTDIYYTVECMS